ncbi:MAG: hypothetical protein IJX28_07040 [Clostridia bacterium]|nr:hypothetical protein [Clostridia bacterium]
MSKYLQGIALLVILGVLLGAVSCAPSVPAPLEALAGSFSAQVGGEMNGVEFYADMEILREGETTQIRLIYRSPVALEGLTLEQTGGKDAPVTVRLGELALEVSAAAVAGWMRPARVLLDLQEQDLQSAERTGEDSYRFVFSGDQTLTVTAQGLPLAYESPSLTFSILRFQNK